MDVPSHSERFLPALVCNLLHKSRHIPACQRIGDPVSQLRLDVFPKHALEFAGAPLLADHLIGQIDPIKLAHRSDAAGVAAHGARLLCDALTLLDIDKEVASFAAGIREGETRAVPSNGNVQPLSVDPLAKDVGLDPTPADPQPETGNDRVRDLDLTRDGRLQAGYSCVRQTDLFRHFAPAT